MRCAVDGGARRTHPTTASEWTYSVFGYACGAEHCRRNRLTSQLRTDTLRKQLLSLPPIRSFCEGFLHATAFVLGRDGMVVEALYSTSGVGQLGVRETIGLLDCLAKKRI